MSPLFGCTRDNLQLFRFIACKVCHLLIEAVECINQNCLDSECDVIILLPYKKYWVRFIVL